MRIERRFTRAGEDAYDGIEFRKTTSEIRNPDGSVVFSARDIDVPAPGRRSPATSWRRSTSARPACRRAAAGAPSPACRPGSGATRPTRRARRAARGRAPQQRRDRCAPGLRPAGRHLDLLGLEGRLLRRRGRRARLLRRAARTCWRARWPRPTRRSGSTPACTGPTASTARRRATSTSTSRPASWSRSTSPTSTRSRTPASSSRSPTTSSTRAASWTCGCARRGSSSTARAPAPTSRALRGENEPLSGGGKSSGLMSFLKIGDRAAGAIKSGGTTRRAAKMVIVDARPPRHRGVRQLEGRRGAEGRGAWSPARKTAQLAPQRGHAGLPRRAPTTTRFDPQAQPARCKTAIRAARQAMIPENYVQRVIQFASQGYTRDRVPATTPTGTRDAYLTVSGQNSNNSVRVTNDFLEAVRGRRRLER